MAKHLTENDIEAIVNMINGWGSEKISWTKICESAEPLIGKLPTRQSLNSYKDIVFAYTAKKKGLKIAEPAPKKVSSLTVAAQRLSSLESKIAQLKEENNSYKEMFVLWQYNAYRLGIKEHDLNAPLPKINRERTDGERR
ncbi:hypothetical protein [Erwinia mallotivora]|uniref:Uncharacterized protein n=1 Tax=Erwinia mallotivora TaxID=69222 RepID=A0A014Q0T5_9GAMM|nr:hypothetical protein [Erwinia mallotivora]EXU76757.1 hypothetical protein BG55_03795 [Erwinia mallotivora]